MVPKNNKILFVCGKNVCYRSIFGHDRFRSGRGRIEVGKTHRGRARGGPSGTIYGQNLARQGRVVGVTRMIEPKIDRKIVKDWTIK